ncbi:hypothetical protein RB6905 [Rhodopirellula baltica SH 1]|uniref:Uncharacterized protein n=1 Tax=Rhodopirellula baltica (strain DSM 10527 / NCIMB 13988 / SH1) TaxID=243090 RepID=Q7UPJ3_RHOBA|nr:hypothetical protein RB6905 [Rhodopirellula baltica SH 1]
MLDYDMSALVALIADASFLAGRDGECPRRVFVSVGVAIAYRRLLFEIPAGMKTCATIVRYITKHSSAHANAEAADVIGLLWLLV